MVLQTHNSIEVFIFVNQEEHSVDIRAMAEQEYQDDASGSEMNLQIGPGKSSANRFVKNQCKINEAEIDNESEQSHEVLVNSLIAADMLRVMKKLNLYKMMMV